ncbi:MAG: hypothetical protein CVT66_03225 [Actinobacteria bacterium HGW-Actinobacteria-6]|jgi:uncharacterized membrane protein|nr:MAG: hypothetical protein CVT66_03225 [Actinobacteria bacterium HGW-Actinobacteria-6]
MMNQGWGYGTGMGGIGVGEILFLIFGALVVAGIVVLIIWAVRSSRDHGSKTSAAGSGQAIGGPSVGHDEAVAIAKRRLATGEITKEQYDEIVTALGG